jgi:hypothetical protein
MVCPRIINHVILLIIWIRLTIKIPPIFLNLILYRLALMITSPLEKPGDMVIGKALVLDLNK